MPYTIKTQQIAVKDPDTGEYSGVDVLAEQTTEGLLNEIEVKGTTVKNEVDGYITDARADIDQLEIDANTLVTNAQAQVARANNEVDTLTASITSAIEDGVDRTLTRDGVPADAAACGDLKSALGEEIDGVITAKQSFTASAYPDGELRINSGGINGNGNDNNNVDTRSRTRYFDIVPGRRYLIKLQTPNYVIINAFEYSAASTAATTKQKVPLTDDHTIIFNALETVNFARISFANSDTTATMTDTDRSNILNALELYALTDATLTESGVPADAKVTGEKIEETNGKLLVMEPYVNGLSENINIGSLTSGYMDTLTGGVRSSSSGLGVTDYIDIHNYVKLKYSRMRSISATAQTGICFFDEEKSFIGSIISLRSQPEAKYDNVLYSADIPDGAYYVRLTGFLDTAIYGTMTVIGIKASIPNDIDDVSRIPQIGNIFCVQTTLPGVDTFNKVIALYDSLVESYPLILSKNILNNSSFTNYEYVFSTGNYNTKGKRSRDSAIVKPKVLITSGVHGAERSAVMSLYYFIKSMCDNVYALGEVIQSVEYHIIPVGCPWGFDNNSRTNENGVNINRNFATSDWTKTSTGDDYSGDEAGDQLETQVIQTWLVNNGDASLYIDYHNSGFSDEVSCLLGLSTENYLTAKRNYLLSINKIIPYMRKVRGIGQTNIFAYTGNTNIPGAAKGYGAEHGIMSYTFETSNNIENRGLYGEFVNAIGCEMFGATMQGLVKYILT